MEDGQIIVRWKTAIEEAESAVERAFRFLRILKLKPRKPVDKLAKAVHTEVFSEINCVRCANCCRTLKPEFRPKDIASASIHLNISEDDLKAQYLQQNAQGNWETRTLPCPFLSENGFCGIYPVRPGDCSGFPHTDKSNFAARSWTHAENVRTCPAVFEILERMEIMING